MLVLTLRYDSGHPTRLEKHTRAALLAALLGAPESMRRTRDGWRIEWAERDGNGARLGASLHLPRGWDAGRALVALEASPEAFEAARLFARADADAKSAAVSEAEESLEAARSAYAHAEARYLWHAARARNRGRP